MGMEYESVKLTDVYCKANGNKVTQKYGKAFLISLGVTHEGDPTVNRLVRNNPDFCAQSVTETEAQEEEKLLDEQKLFQSLHEQLVTLQRCYGKTTEQMSELFLRVCGDLTAVEAALQGKTEGVVEWTYLEDLALTKPAESVEFQWLLKTKGPIEIEKRKKFLLTADQPNEQVKVVGEEDDEEDDCGQGIDDDHEMSCIPGDVLAKMKEEGTDWAAEAVGYC